MVVSDRRFRLNILTHPLTSEYTEATTGRALTGESGYSNNLETAAQRAGSVFWGVEYGRECMYMYGCVCMYVCGFSTFAFALIFLVCVADYMMRWRLVPLFLSWSSFIELRYPVQDRSHCPEATWICTNGITAVFRRTERLSDEGQIRSQ